MPLVRISLRTGKSADYRRAIGDAVHRAMVELVFRQWGSAVCVIGGIWRE
ncbi:MAG TPA: tautomerase family protein [Anaerolineae bacterium]|nr:tautomerase family protein [Anaerolineae bacterium]